MQSACRDSGGAGGRAQDWYGGMGLMDFLRETGRYARVGTMLAKDSVRTRLDSPSGISFTEFCYQLL